ncbi:MAG: hypothetical protein L0Z52_01965 [Acidobacteria bacterium]|nr:hypothetical protein [Acidobacteriota bacterium]
MLDSNQAGNRTRLIRLGVGAVLGLSLGCSDVRVAPEEKLVFQYSEGIQSLHQPTYEESFLSCHPEWPERDLSARMAGYEELRRSGKITFSEDGVELIKLAILGRGGYFKVMKVLREGNRLQFRTLVKPDYISINYIDRSAFPAGAILYLFGEPLGTVISLKPGKTRGPERSVLESLELSWLWTPNTLGKADWCLESVAPITSTASFRILQFNEDVSPKKQSSETGSDR